MIILSFISENLSSFNFDSDQLTDDDYDACNDNDSEDSESDVSYKATFSPRLLRRGSSRRGSNLFKGLDFIASAKRKRNTAKIAKKMKKIAQSGTEERRKFLLDVALHRVAEIGAGSEMGAGPSAAASPRSRELPTFGARSVSSFHLLESKSPLRVSRSVDIGAPDSAPKSDVAHSFSLPSKIPDAPDKKCSSPPAISTLLRKNAERRKLPPHHESTD